VPRPLGALLLGSSVAFFCTHCRLEREPPPVSARPSAGAVELRVATWNVFLRPLDGVLPQIPASDARCRAEEIGDFLAQSAQGYDLVALQEAFDTDLLASLVEHGSAAYPERVLQRPAACEAALAPYCTLINGGLSMLGGPRSSFASAVSEGYEACGGIDCLSNKGLLYVPVEVQSRAATGPAELGVNVLTTHLDAGSHSPARAAQIEQIRAFLERSVCSDPERSRWPAIVLGDFNVLHVGGLGHARSAELNAEYRRLLGSLSPSCFDAPRDVYAELFVDWPREQPEAGTRVCRGNALLPCDQHFDPSGRIDYVFVLEPKAAGLEQVPSIDVLSARTRTVAAPRCFTPSLSDHKLLEATIQIGYGDEGVASRAVLSRTFD
jgi:endonuclease/exonuclease/phosphatase family metal-dependent hydrolase